MPRGATQSPIACRAAIPERTGERVGRATAHRQDDGVHAVDAALAPVIAVATTTAEPSTATSAVCGVSVTPLRNRRGSCCRYALYPSTGSAEVPCCKSVRAEHASAVPVLSHRRGHERRQDQSPYLQHDPPEIP